VWAYAWEHDYVVVTTNGSDFLTLLARKSTRANHSQGEKPCT
jgi:hypothetical protein